MVLRFLMKSCCCNIKWSCSFICAYHLSEYVQSGSSNRFSIAFLRELTFVIPHSFTWGSKWENVGLREEKTLQNKCIITHWPQGLAVPPLQTNWMPGSIAYTLWSQVLSEGCFLDPSVLLQRFQTPWHLLSGFLRLGLDGAINIRSFSSFQRALIGNTRHWFVCSTE